MALYQDREVEKYAKREFARTALLHRNRWKGTRTADLIKFVNIVLFLPRMNFQLLHTFSATFTEDSRLRTDDSPIGF